MISRRETKQEATGTNRDDEGRKECVVFMRNFVEHILSLQLKYVGKHIESVKKIPGNVPPSTYFRSLRTPPNRSACIITHLRLV